MKNLLIFLLIAVLGTAVKAQYGYQNFIQDTTKGSETVYFTSSVKVPYSGIVSFEGNLDGFAANDDVVVILQGSNDNWTKVFNIDTIPTYSSTTLTPFALFDNANYLNYRLKAVGAATDTVLIKNVLFIYKR